LSPFRESIEWVEGELGDRDTAARLVRGCDAVIHAGLYRPGKDFRGGEGDVIEFAEKNVIGSLQLMEAARAADVGRFVYISTCAVHEIIRDDRPLDEMHPLWPTSHYGAHKAAVEKFAHSYGLGHGYPVCALRPTGVYGLDTPVPRSKWYDLIQRVVQGQSVECQRGGKEVHAADVARACELLLTASGVAGQAYNCYDQYVSWFDVATMAKRFAGSDATILGQQTAPRHQIENGKIKSIGMRFGGQSLLEDTVRQLVQHARQ
jgi:nucleoside-diphosphate-sugar epimerase